MGVRLYRMKSLGGRATALCAAVVAVLLIVGSGSPQALAAAAAARAPRESRAAGSPALGAVVFHWFNVPPVKVGQAASAWPAALPPRDQWVGSSFWGGEERHLSRAGVDFELLQLARERTDELRDHLAVVRRPCGLMVAEETMPWGYGHPDQPLTPELVADAIVEAYWLLMEYGVEPFEVDGRFFVHLWHISGEEDIADPAGFYRALREDVWTRTAGVDLFLSSHPAWPTAENGPEETVKIFGNDRYRDFKGRSAAVRPGFLHCRKAQLPQLPRLGGAPYRDAWNEVRSRADLVDRVYVAWNEIAEGSQIRPCAPTRHEPDDPLYPATYESAVAGLPVVARNVDAPDWWGRGPRRYLKLTRKGSRRWKAAWREAHGLD